MTEFARGSLRRITLTNFMQYDEVSFSPGPHLNVILGPNGSGKSSMVNAITIGLAGKMASLGRATHLQEFIRTGKQEAKIEISLFRDKDKNDRERCWVIERKFGQDGKSLWRLDGIVVKQKEVETLAKELNIQTENLCQFLPQDKVHEFSRMNPKELLCKTVEAVGETQLKEDHETLKNLQKKLGDSEETHQNKLQQLKDQKKKCEKLEEQAQHFREREALTKKIKLLEQRRDWALVTEQKKIWAETNKRYLKIEKEKASEEAKSIPVREKLKRIKKSRSASMVKTGEIMQAIKDCVNSARTKSQKIEAAEEELDKLDEDHARLVRDEERKKERLRVYEADIAQMEEEMAEKVDPNLEPMIRKLTAEATDLRRRRDEAASNVDDCKHERIAIERRVKEIRTQMEELQNVSKLKLEALRKLPQGEDAVTALEWVNNNRPQFRGRIYDPVLLNIDMHDPKDAVFLENCVANRDLIAFGAENADDMNLLLNELRGRMKLKVNVIQMDPEANPDLYQPTVKSFPPALNYRGVVKDLFKAPDAVKVALCKLFQIHETPVFKAMPNKTLEQLVNKYKFKVFFVGDTRYSCIVSRYGEGSVSTNSHQMVPKGWLHFSMDKDKRTELNRQMEEQKERNIYLLQQLKELSDVAADMTKSESMKMSELRQMRQKNDHKKVLEARLQAKRDQMKGFLATDGNVAGERRRIAQRKQQLGRETLTAADGLKNAIFRGNDLKIRSSVLALQKRLESEEQELLERILEEMEQGMQEVNERLAVEKDALEEADGELKVRQRMARTRMGQGFTGDKPTRALEQEFAANNLPEDSAACVLQLTDMQTSLDCLEDVDYDVIREYNELKRSIAGLEEEVDSYEQQLEQRQGDISAIRERWQTRLNELVGRIASRFSHYFDSMGFAGDVNLCTGNHANDFVNFGIDILVKYRANEPLQRLNPHQQSGGERSVATALYMMALQELTVVPFRCVDEINQGMDAVNERRVFDLLVQISCRESSAQYFLLTPKLLPNLNYDRNMNVLIVNNGPGMCHHEEWDIGRFLEASRNAA